MLMPELDAAISRNLAWAAAEQLTETTAARIQASVAETLALELIRFEAQRIPVPWGLLVRDFPWADWHEQEEEPAVMEITRPEPRHVGAAYGDIIMGSTGMWPVEDRGAFDMGALIWMSVFEDTFRAHLPAFERLEWLPPFDILIEEREFNELCRLPVQRRKVNRCFPDDRGADEHRVKRATNPHRRETWETISGSGGSGALVADLLTHDGPYPVSSWLEQEERDDELMSEISGGGYHQVIFDETEPAFDDEFA